MAILQVDTDRRLGTIDPKIYGQFLEDINHSVVDGLFAEQIRGAGFEGRDFETYWTPFGPPDAVRVVETRFERGTKSVRISAGRQRRESGNGECSWSPAGAMTGRSGSRSSPARRVCRCACWRRMEHVLADLPLRTRGSAWQEVPFSFASTRTRSRRGGRDRRRGRGRGARRFRLDDARGRPPDGMLRPDLLRRSAILRPRSFAGPADRLPRHTSGRTASARYVSRAVPPQPLWGGYSDYYGFGTDEFLGLTRRKLGAEPLIVLAAPGTAPSRSNTR